MSDSADDGSSGGDAAGWSETAGEGTRENQPEAPAGPAGPPVANRPAGGGPDEQPPEWVLMIRDVVTSVAAVFLIGVYLFAISGVWPPMVAIESGSMEPHMNINDLVFVMDTDRFQPAEAHEETGIVTAKQGRESDYTQFEGYGDVIVFEPNGDSRQTPIIHRAMFWVEAGENWCEQAEMQYIGGLDPQEPRCFAPHDGFITKGDDNRLYDQARSGAPVKPEWVVGTAEARVPKIGWLRLRFQ